MRFLVFAEARKQVMEATERLGGQYSPDLHPQCTHLVVQISFNFTCFFLSTITRYVHWFFSFFVENQEFISFLVLFTSEYKLF